MAIEISSEISWVALAMSGKTFGPEASSRVQNGQRAPKKYDEDRNSIPEKSRIWTPGGSICSTKVGKWAFARDLPESIESRTARNTPMCFMDLIDSVRLMDNIAAVNVKRDRFADVLRLDNAVDLGIADGRAQKIAVNAAKSLAGAAEVAGLAIDRRVDGLLPGWASGLGLTASVAGVKDWLDQRSSRDRYAHVREIPADPEEHQPGSDFILFQDEATSRFTRAGMRRSMARKIIGAFSEMAHNATDHSDSPVAPLATFELWVDRWEFSVTDFGRGVPNSLRTNPMYKALNDREAVREALKEGVSRLPDGTRGRGYGTMFRALAEYCVDIRMRTARVVASWSGLGVGVTDVVFKMVGSRSGLHVRVAGDL